MRSRDPFVPELDFDDVEDRPAYIKSGEAFRLSQKAALRGAAMLFYHVQSVLKPEYATLTGRDDPRAKILGRIDSKANQCLDLIVDHCGDYIGDEAVHEILTHIRQMVEPRQEGTSTEIDPTHSADSTGSTDHGTIPYPAQRGADDRD